MATGNMAGFRSLGKILHSTLLLAMAVLAPLPAHAQDVGLAGIMGSKAMLIVNGGQPEAVRVGESIGGVKLVAIQGEQVIVEVGGRKRPLRIGQHAVGASSADGSGRITLTADGRGHFYTTGTINGTSIRFLVDTGATMISLGASDARRLGLDFNRGEKGFSQTANGQTLVSKVKLDTVTIAGVTLRQVDAVLHQTDMPIALLGMSFLNRMEMQHDGGTMTLRQRY